MKKTETPPWLQLEAERMYPATNIRQLLIAQAERLAHIRAVMGCLERVAERAWLDGYYTGFSDPAGWEAAKQQFIDKLKNEGV
jgi:hypothetical protein